MTGLRAARALDRLNAYTPARKLPHVSMGWLSLFNAAVSFNLAYWAVQSIPAAVFERLYLDVTPLLVWFNSFILAIALFLILRPILAWVLFLSPMSRLLERQGLVFVAEPWVLRILNGYLENEESQCAAEVVKPHLARILRASPNTRLSHAGALVAYLAVRELHKQHLHEAFLAEIANREKELQEKEAASPLGILAAQARRAQALDEMVNQDVSRPDGDRPQL